MSHNNTFSNKRITELEESGYFSQQQKKVHYTVTEIGGHNELIEWRKLQSQKEQEYQTAKAETREQAKFRAVEMVEAQRESDRTKARIAEEVRIEEARRKNYTSAPQIHVYSPQLYTQHTYSIHTTIFQRAKEALANLWRNAFDN